VTMSGLPMVNTSGGVLDAKAVVIFSTSRL
jgi:hypothetical protein